MNWEELPVLYSDEVSRLGLILLGIVYFVVGVLIGLVLFKELSSMDWRGNT